MSRSLKGPLQRWVISIDLSFLEAYQLTISTFRVIRQYCSPAAVRVPGTITKDPCPLAPAIDLQQLCRYHAHPPGPPFSFFCPHFGHSPQFNDIFHAFSMEPRIIRTPFDLISVHRDSRFCALYTSARCRGVLPVFPAHFDSREPSCAGHHSLE